MNKCHFLGKVASTPELQKENDVPVIYFELEVEEFRKNNKGEKVRDVTYLNFEAWDSAALTIAKYVKANDLMAIESVARSFKYANPNDEDYNLETYFRITNFKILGS